MIASGSNGEPEKPHMHNCIMESQLTIMSQVLKSIFKPGAHGQCAWFLKSL